MIALTPFHNHNHHSQQIIICRSITLLYASHAKFLIKQECVAMASHIAFQENACHVKVEILLKICFELNLILASVFQPYVCCSSPYANFGHEDSCQGFFASPDFLLEYYSEDSSD